MRYYHGNETGQIIGMLPQSADYAFWWESGAMWGTMMDYWRYTKDDTYNPLVTQGMVAQAGPPANKFIPSNWSSSIGNDDQGFWGMSAILAAELNFPNPPPNQPQYLELAQAVFNSQTGADHWDDICGGGIRWQIIMNSGYQYKNAIANGILFNMGARLARFTGNNSYADWSNKVWNWANNSGIIGKNYAIYDGIHVEKGCSLDPVEYSYNSAVFMQGAAFMYNIVSSSIIPDICRQC
jgi:mannan endo-1,6-alpha-mannosidase